MTANRKYATGMVLILLFLIALYIADRVWLKKRKIALGPDAPFTGLEKNTLAVELLLACVAATVYILFSNHKYTPFNNYAYLADAWLHGRLDSPELPEYLESIQFGGTTYVHFAPGPALLCLPFVAVFGVNGFNSGFVCLLLGPLTVALCHRVLTYLKLGNGYTRLWMTALFCFGTVFFWCVSIGAGWQLGHISTLFFLFLAMCFLFRREDSLIDMFLSGLFFGLAVCCRLSALLGGLFFAGYILMKKERKLKALLCFAGGAAIFGSMYMLYNYVRFGTIMDESYNLTYLKDYHRDQYDNLQQVEPSLQLATLRAMNAESGGALQLRFFSYNFKTLFTQMPVLNDCFPWIHYSHVGVAITLVSPALLVFAFLCPWKKRITWLLWATVILTAIPYMLNYGNGQSQFGMRYSLDFTPYLFLLCCMGMEKLRSWKKILTLWCVLINASGTLYWVCYLWA